MSVRKLIIVGFLVGLAACTSEQTAQPEAVENGADGLAMGNDAVPVTNDIAATADPDTAVSSGSSDATSIPAAFHGRWGMTPEDCTSTRGDAKGLLVIDATTMRFYESRAIPRNIEVRGPNEWRADLDYSGEGQTWSEKTIVTLSNGGKTLRRMADGPWTYQRCENQA
jgi:hypothetical protein